MRYSKCVQSISHRAMTHTLHVRFCCSLMLLPVCLQFWKDSSNLRDDEYGGSDENKGRWAT
jgi:hypothetical protein